MNGSKEGFGAMAGALWRVEPALPRTVAGELWFNQVGFRRQERCAAQRFREVPELPCEGRRADLCLFPASAHPDSRCYS